MPLEALLILPEIVPPQEPLPPEPPPPPVPPALPEAPVAAPPPAPVPPPPAPAAAAPAATPVAKSKEAPQYYPREAVLRGIEGEVLVRLRLDSSGRVVSARLARSSGHAILDKAALRAARTLKTIPGGRREAMLPVRFRLR
jgi:protein TonB